ncbi:ADP-ribosylation factor GTPase activating protein, ER-Golgi transport [Xylographa soralifera]|nr:ADP-ribosylation factor GTPase activating protein, ER-Golgi transport [Xylographa soralifera]
MAGFCAGTSVPDCTANYTSITSDPDVDGIGVVVSFLVSAGLTLVTSLIGLVLEQLPTKRPKNDKGSPDDGSPGLRESIRKKIAIKKESREYIEAIIERFVLGLADVQLLTGTSMLLVAFLKCDITTYHFGIIIDLVWFSSNSHLTAMLILSDYLREYHAARFWRVILMGSMCLLLMVSTILTTNQLWYDQLPLPVRCTFLDDPGNMQGSFDGFTALTFILLVWGYSTTILPLFAPTNDLIEGGSKKIKKWMEAQRKLLKDISSTHSRLRIFAIGLPFRCVYGFMIVVEYFQYFNFLFDLTFYGLGVWTLFGDIASGQMYIATSNGGVQSWGFGQLIPMFLLSLPVLTVLEIFWEETKDFKARKQSKADAADAKLRLASTAIPTSSAYDYDITEKNTSPLEKALEFYDAGTHHKTNEDIDSQSDDEMFEPPSRQDTEQRIAGIDTSFQFRKDSTSPQAFNGGGNRPSNSRPRASLGPKPLNDAPGQRSVLATLVESSSTLSLDSGQSSDVEPRLTIPERRPTPTT